jgi:hypothetical protein
MTYDQWKTTDPRDRWDQGKDECTCRRTGAGQKVDRWCPRHGLDPDAERERIRDEDWR